MKQTTSYYLAIASFFLVLISHLVMRPDGSAQWLPDSLIPFLKICPLLLVIPGLLKQQWRAYAWLSFMLLIYFMAAFDTAWTSGGAWLPVLSTLVSLTLFCQCILVIRALKRDAPPIPNTSDNGE